MGKPKAWDNSVGASEAPHFGLRILATTDLHMHLNPHNYYTDAPDDTTGLVRTAALIRAARAEAERAGHSVVLVDNGDFLQGTPMGEVSVAPDSGPHPMMRAFESLGYDAIGLGNHDFDFGPDVLFRILRDAPCPVISSNLTGDTDIISRSACQQFDRPGAPPLTLGILSVLPPQTALWNAHWLTDRIGVDDMVDIAHQEAAALKARGCDLVVVLAHTGLGTGVAAERVENAAILIAGLEDVDAVVAGHTHQLFPGDGHEGIDAVDGRRGLVHGTPVVMAGSAGSHLGLMDLTLRHTASGWALETCDVSLRPIAQRDATGQLQPTVTSDPELARLIGPAHDTTRAALNAPVGRIGQRLHSYFSLFGPDRGLALVADAQAEAVRPTLAQAGLGHLPLLSAVAPSKFGARSGPDAYTDVPPGPVTLRHLADLHVYRNELRVVQMTMGQVLDWLEMSASLFNFVPDGSQAAALLPDDVAGYNFDVIHGLTYRIDPSQPARYSADGTSLTPGSTRIRDARFQGAPVDPQAMCLVVSNSYRVNGGGNIPALRGARTVAAPPIELRDAVRAHVTRGLASEISPSPWRLANLPGTGVIVPTGPPADTLITELSEHQPQDLGLHPSGFRHMRLAL